MIEVAAAAAATTVSSDWLSMLSMFRVVCVGVGLARVCLCIGLCDPREQSTNI